MKVKNSQEFSYLRIDNGPSGRNQARPVAWCGWEMRRLVGVDPVRHSTWRATGRIGAGRDRPELARWWYGRAMSARSSVSKTENGSSNPATTAMRFAPALARLPARLRSGGVDRPSSSPFLESKGPPKYRAAQFLKDTVRAIGLLPSAACCSGQC